MSPQEVAEQARECVKRETSHAVEEARIGSFEDILQSEGIDHYEIRS